MAAVLAAYWDSVVRAFVFFFGATIGSFANVVIARLPKDESIVQPGSRCPHCKTPIRWYDNVPVLSWLFLRARCRACRAPISLRYPVVELLVGLLALACVQRWGLGPPAVGFFILCTLLVVLSYIDLDTWLLPHLLTWPGIAAGLVFSFINPEAAPADALIGAGAGFLAFWLVAEVGARIFKAEALGGGDIWLLAMIGAWLGWRALLPVVLLSSLQGAVVGSIMILTKRNEAKAEPPPETEVRDPPGKDDEDGEEWVPPPHAVPFGPFLALGALEQLFMGAMLQRAYEGWLMRLWS